MWIQYNCSDDSQEALTSRPVIHILWYIDHLKQLTRLTANTLDLKIDVFQHLVAFLYTFGALFLFEPFNSPTEECKKAQTLQEMYGLFIYIDCHPFLLSIVIYSSLCSFIFHFVQSLFLKSSELMAFKTSFMYDWWYIHKVIAVHKNARIIVLLVKIERMCFFFCWEIFSYKFNL